mmetsp:Transcript_18544/g.27467  ORF Transcript_18544/g.27467 Transcript_18544/m.27467 type:complete len:243 (-) Transcript_18544:99-827(-)
MRSVTMVAGWCLRPALYMRSLISSKRRTGHLLLRISIQLASFFSFDSISSEQRAKVSPKKVSRASATAFSAEVTELNLAFQISTASVLSCTISAPAASWIVIVAGGIGGMTTAIRFASIASRPLATVLVPSTFDFPTTLIHASSVSWKVTIICSGPCFKLPPNWCCSILSTPWLNFFLLLLLLRLLPLPRPPPWPAPPPRPPPPLLIPAPRRSSPPPPPRPPTGTAAAALLIVTMINYSLLE